MDQKWNKVFLLKILVQSACVFHKFFLSSIYYHTNILCQSLHYMWDIIFLFYFINYLFLQKCNLCSNWKMFMVNKETIKLTYEYELCSSLRMRAQRSIIPSVRFRHERVRTAIHVQWLYRRQWDFEYSEGL